MLSRQGGGQCAENFASRYRLGPDAPAIAKKMSSADWGNLIDDIAMELALDGVCISVKAMESVKKSP